MAQAIRRHNAHSHRVDSTTQRIVPANPLTSWEAGFESERRLIVSEHRDTSACITLWRVVIERTVDDIHFLRNHVGKRKLKKHEEETLRRIRENPPMDFIDGFWFEQVCDYLDVNPEKIRRGIANRLSGA